MTCLPRTQMRLTSRQVGEQWDVVRMRAALGTQVVAAIGDDCGSAVTDAMQTWFFVRPGAGREFDDVPGVTVCLPGSHVLIPADDVTSPPGPHWCRIAAHRITPAGLLLRAIGEAEQ